MDRKGLLEWFSFIEKKNDLTSLKYRGIDLWPIIKCDLFFLWHNSLQSNQKNAIDKKSMKFSVKNIFLDFFNLILKRKKIFRLFAGFSAHRSIINNVYVSKFFESIFSSSNDYVQIEYGNRMMNMNYSHEEKTLFIEKFLGLIRFLGLFKKRKVINDKIFNNIIDQFNDCVIPVSDNDITRLKSKIHLIYLYSIFYSLIIKLTNVKVAYILCYYNVQMFGLIYALNKKGVITYDVQHGSQGKLHPMYQFNLSNLKEGNFNTLPAKFWVWDTPSYNSLISWLPNDRKGDVELNGNPWIDYSISLYKDRYSQFFKDTKRIILITLQESIINDIFLDLIDNLDQEKFEWWIRFHPRMVEKKDYWKKYFLNKKINNINIDFATELPLPLILSYTFLHISRYSGSIIEGCHLNVKTFITDEIGIITYEDYVDNVNVFDVSKYDDVNKIKELILELN